VFTGACSMQTTREHKVFCSVLINPNCILLHTVEVTHATKLPTAVVTLIRTRAIFTTALYSRCGHYIFVLWFLLPSYSTFFLAHSQPSHIGCLPYFHTWCGLSANLGSRSETCCTWLAENTVTGRTKSPKIRHLSTIAQLCRAISSQLRHVSTIGKNLLNSNITSTCLYNMANLAH